MTRSWSLIFILRANSLEANVEGLAIMRIERMQLFYFFRDATVQSANKFLSENYLWFEFDSSAWVCPDEFRHPSLISIGSPMHADFLQ